MSDNIKDVDVEIDVTSTTEETETENTPATEVSENTATEDTSTDAPKEDGAVETLSFDPNADDEDDDDEEEEEPSDGKKKKKKPLTRQQKKKRRRNALISVCSVVLVIAIFVISLAIANPLGVKALLKQAQSFTKVEYADGEQFVMGYKGADGVNLYKDTDGFWTFKTDEEFKVLQFTDVHIGGGSFSKEKDMWAMNAVATMIRAEKPDLVIVTGDIAFPVPYASGSFNNLGATQIFANMMESLGVYWTFAFGNHDTEAYSMYTREDICKYYEEEIKNGTLKHCLFQRGFASEENGYGNSIIKVVNSNGIVTQALVTFDSHSYIEGDYFGMAWKYDNIHEEQIQWYAGEMKKFVAQNREIDPSSATEVKNLAFFHIPLVEYREAWREVIESGKTPEKGEVLTNSERGVSVKFEYGVMGESDKMKNGQRTYGVFCGLHEDNLFEIGFDNGLQGTFCGHDHYNNFSVSYTKDGKTIKLTYGMSIDYLAYPGIYKEHLQRGCTVITVRPDGSFDNVPKNYYSDYGVSHEKG